MDIPANYEEPLRRARRFLILMSAGLAAYFIFGIEVRPDADYAGLSLRARDPRLSLLALWLVWGWAALRYFQFSYQALSHVWGDVLEDVEAETVRIIKRLAGNGAASMVRNGERQGVPTDAKLVPPIEMNDVTAETLRSRAMLRQPIAPDYVPDDDGGRHYTNLQATFVARTGSAIAVHSIGFNFQLSGSEMRSVRWRAWFYASMALPAVSEHIFPLVFALGALLSAVLANHSACFAEWCAPTAPLPATLQQICSALFCPR